MTDATIWGKPVSWWETEMERQADGSPFFRGLRVEPSPGGVLLAWSSWDIPETPWPAMRVSGPRDEEAGYAEWREPPDRAAGDAAGPGVGG